MNDNINKEEIYQLSGLNMARGAIAVIFGITALVWPGMTLVSLAVITSIWFFLSGVTGVLTSVFMHKSYEHWFLRLILSGIQLGIGAYIIQRPGISISTFMLAVGFSFIVEGVIEIIFAITDTSHRVDGGLRALSVIGGLLTVGGGMLIWRYPVSGTLAFVWVLGLLALISGMLSLWVGIEARNNISNNQ